MTGSCDICGHWSRYDYCPLCAEWFCVSCWGECERKDCVSCATIMSASAR